MSGRLLLKSKTQTSRGATAWSVRESIVINIWNIVWTIFLKWTPKKMNWCRLLCLKLFGAKIHGRPFVFSSAKIFAPFNLEIYDHACIGPMVNIYNLGMVILGENSIISQETMLCGGTHDLTLHHLPLMVGDIEIGKDVFIGVKAVVLPGLTIKDGSVIGAASVVTKDVSEWTIVAGNPAREIGKRSLTND